MKMKKLIGAIITIIMLSSMSYGYTKEKGQKIQEIEPNEARIVKEIFEMCIDKNMSMSKIAKTLNERKIPTKNNTSWDSNTIKKALTNPNYIGKVRYSINDEDRYFEADGNHERIISDEMYTVIKKCLTEGHDGFPPCSACSNRPRKSKWTV